MNVIAAGPTAEGVTRVPAKVHLGRRAEVGSSDGDHAAAGQASRGGVIPVIRTSAGGCAGAENTPVHGVPAFACRPMKSFQYMARSATKSSPPAFKEDGEASP